MNVAFNGKSMIRQLSPQQEQCFENKLKEKLINFFYKIKVFLYVCFFLLNYLLEDLISGVRNVIICVGFHVVSDDDLDCSWLLLNQSVFLFSQV